jgi:hypothetical protein|tara:strand:- start:366 stop:839 length:474 start_codon:yes stop_codon:yes gene_type:complete
MIEAQTAGELNTQQQASTTPQTITTTMIVADLDNGIDREGIRLKYNLEKWEVSEVFKHPALKGKKVRKKRRLSFQFLDDTPTVNPAQTSIPVETTSPQEHIEKLFKTPSLEETADMLYGVDNTNVESTFDQQTRVEEGLDHKGETFDDDSNETLNIN